MSNGGKITRHTIPGEEIKEFFFLGVVSAEPDYRLSVLINRHLGTDLRKCDDEITVQTDSGRPSFSRFTTVPPELSLVSNRSEGYILLRKLKNIDFFLLICGQSDMQKAEKLAATLREIPEITAVFVLDSRKISDKNLLLLAL
ncbi:MAG: IPExxxVDY family protein [Bacteroidales bacterium]